MSAQNGEKTEQDWLDRIHGALRLLRGVYYAVQSREDAARILGMDRLADDLESMAKDLDTAISEADRAVGDAISEYTRQSSEANMNMLKASLAGVLIAREGRD